MRRTAASRSSDDFEEGAGRAPLDPRRILTSIGAVVYDWDVATDGLSWSGNAGDVLGVDVRRLASGRAFGALVEPGSGLSRHEAILRSEERDAGTGVSYRTRYLLRLKGDALLAVEDTGRWYADAEGRPALAHGVLRLERASDGAGGALSLGERERAGFLTALRSEVAEAGRSKRPLTLLVIAIEGLGQLNDDLGFEAADELIAEVMRRLRTVMRRRDSLARYAGNRFALALAHCRPDQAKPAAERMLEVATGQPILAGDEARRIRLRIGAATAPQHAVEAMDLLRHAEEALSSAKRDPSRPVALYDPAAMRDAARRAKAGPRLDMLDALNGRRIVLARQPVVEASSRQPAFFEALLRVRTPEGKLFAAADVLPGLERTGIIPLVDGRMLELAADRLAAHPQERLSVNVSPLTLESPEWLGLLASHLGARPGIASRLIIEIVETAAVRDPAATRARLDAMKALGVAIAIDDFGAGHTSFKHLRNFPVDILKIDGAFVQNLSRSSDDRFFVRALVDLAHHLGIATVAEWVEDEEAARLLTEWGVDFLQGDHCGRPVADDAESREGRRAVAG